MPKKTGNDAAKKKAAKEKKLLIVLIVVLVPALGYAYKTISKLNSSSEPVAAATTTTSSSSTTPASSSSGPVDVPAGTPPVSTVTTSSGGLISAVKPPLDQGQLRTFTLLGKKDPFFADGPSANAGAPSGTSTTPGTSTQPTQTTPTQTTPSQPPKPPAPTPTSAVISVNGAEGLVSLHSVFPVSSNPADNGIFRLVALTATSAKIGIVGGSYVNGSSTLTLRVSRPVTLANTANGTRYTLELFPQGTVVPAPPPGGTTTPTTPTTTLPNVLNAPSS